MTGLYEVPEQKICFRKDHYRFLFTISRDSKHIDAQPFVNQEPLGHVAVCAVKEWIK